MRHLCWGLVVLCLLNSVTASSELRQGLPTVWTYTCQNQSCLRVEATSYPNGVPLEVCKLNCQDEGSLFPRPTGQFTVGKTTTVVHRSKVTLTGYQAYPQPVRDLFQEFDGIFHDYLRMMDPVGDTPPEFVDNSLTININVVNTAIIVPKLDTDESYTLTITSTTGQVRAEIQANNYFGARHALETMSQLIAFDSDKKALQVVNSASVADSPAYKYRGVMLDSSRNFIPLPTILRVIDALSFNKMNMFHWHLTDTHAFPMEVTSSPQFTAWGAYSPEKTYSIVQMREVVAYGRVRGVKVVPEFDQPAHTGFGWEWGPKAEPSKGDLAVCINKQPWYDYCVEPPCGQLNIVNDNMYIELEKVFRSMLGVFDNDLFHMGGDEVDFRCYNSTKEITDWMAQRDIATDKEGFVQLWGIFQQRAYDLLLGASTDKEMKAIQWTSELTQKEHILDHLDPAKYIIQIWTDVKSEMIADLVGNNYTTILSNYDVLYLDCGFHRWIGGPDENGAHNWCSPYHTWQEIYDNSPIEIYKNFTNEEVANDAFQRGLFLGAEAPLWTEQADGLSVENRIWPRASALAERLWTNPGLERGYATAELRMITQRQRLVQRGVNADRIQPEFCSQYQNNCFGYPGTPEGPERNGGNWVAASLLTIIIAISTLAL